MEIRLFEEQRDFNEIAQALSLLLDEMAELDSFILPPRSIGDSYLQLSALLNQLRSELAYAIYVVAEPSNKVIGFCAVYVKDTCRDDYTHKRYLRLGNVQELWVRREYRRRGIGTAFLNQARQFAISQGCDYLQLRCLLANEGARQFSMRYGMRQRAVEFIESI